MTSRWTRLLFVLVALGFCAYGVVTQWGAFAEAVSRLSFPQLGGALLAGMAGLGCWMLGWRTLLAGFGAPLPVPATTRIMFLGQLGKYVPGSVWALLGQVELARPYGVARVASGSATLLAMATTVATGCVTAALTLPLTSGDAARDYWWALALAPVMLACLHPRIVTWALNLALRLIRRPPLAGTMGFVQMSTAVLWTLLGWACFGLHTWLLLPTGSPALACGAYALAYVVGFLVILAPGGLGAREAALVLALSPVLSQAEALLVALASRAVLTVADLLWAGIGNLSKPPISGNETGNERLVPDDDQRPLEESP
ncbi:lysylphosphatidylglycerol synthase transmembrane domain-containing protein [Actinocorallia aurantiaca]|uniref:Lysylphosphatidylglycerol synthase transmembrane domain-containing protein n=1 Tax=Actinocorallia aurantiaca TaxID=46204 RepID=A0ABP6H0Z6_9ACTN